MDERTVFMAALEIENPAERAAYLAEACSGSPELRARVERLLDSHEEPGRFLDVPAIEQLSAAPVAPPEHAALHDPSQQNQKARPKADVSDTIAATAETPWGDDEIRVFLQPSQKPGSLGRLDHYEVEEILGKGAFGIVFRAFDEKLRRVVAIKLMAPQLANVATARKRFVREAQAAAAIRDEHVVSIHAVEEGGPLPYLVMEFIAGITLAGKMERDGSLELKEILRIGAQVARGLAAAHREGLIHRDIKPANILLENGVQRVKITDFGLARAADDASLSQSGVIAGTPLYMSPEQTRGELLDQRSDLFSLGSVLYAMCTGHPAFRAGNTVAVIRRVCDHTPRSIRDANPDMTHELEEIVTRLMAKDPAARYQTSEDVAEALCQHLAQVQSKAPRPASAALRTRMSRRWVMGVVASLFFATAFGAAWRLGLFTFGTSGDAFHKADDRRTAAPFKHGKSDHPPPPAPKAVWPAWPADAPPPALVPFGAKQAKEHQEAWAKHLGVPVKHANSIGMEFVLLPPGEFTMGSTAAELEPGLRAAGSVEIWRAAVKSSTPQHQVILTQPIYLAIHEVTQEHYEKVMGNNPSYLALTGAGKNAVRDADSASHPVETVSWFDAVDFCAKLSEREKLAPPPSSGKGRNPYRLPSEAQWEFACRAGTTTKYGTGDDDADLVRAAWFGVNSNLQTHPVGKRKCNSFGLCDMHGNVWEWVHDWWDPTYYSQFQDTLAIDPIGPAAGWTQRVIRGGYWRNDASACRSAHRDSFDPSVRYNYIGFRVALPVEAVRQSLKNDSGKHY